MLNEGMDSILSEWAPLTLKFRDSGKEAQFWDIRVQTLLINLDSMCFLTRSLGLWTICYVLSRSDKLPLPLWSGAVLNGVLYVLMAVGSQRKSWWYSRHRTCLILFCRLLGMIFFTLMLSKIDPPQENVLSFLGWILASAMMGGMACFPLFGELQFWPSAIANSFAALIGACWSSGMYCNAWFEAEGFRTIIDSVTSAIDIGISGFALLSTAPGHLGDRSMEHSSLQLHSCWLVVAFLHVAFAAILPCAAVYCMESHSRVQFLSHGQDENTQLQYKNKWREIVCIVSWCTVVVLMMAWWALHVVADFSGAFHDGGIGSECLARRALESLQTTLQATIP